MSDNWGGHEGHQGHHEGMDHASMDHGIAVRGDIYLVNEGEGGGGGWGCW